MAALSKIRLGGPWKPLVLSFFLVVFWFVNMFHTMPMAPYFPVWPNEEEKDGNVSKYESIALSLESITFRYYLYDDPDINSPSLREAFSKADKVPGELNMLGAFERHHLRTLDPDEADFFIVPILFNGFVGSKKKLHLKLPQAMDSLLAHSVFNKTQGKWHIYFAIGGRIFDYFAPGPVPKLIKSNMRYRQAVANGIVAKDVDMVQCQRMYQDGHDHNDWNDLFKSTRPISPSTFSVGFQTGSKEVPLTTPSYKKFESSNWTFFYHTRVGGSARNSTIYRHAPLSIGRQTSTGTVGGVGDITSILNTSSIGFDIPADEWSYRYLNSKFCLVIRGDDPGSRAFLRSLRVGCIPVVVSDYLERHSPTLKLSLNISDFAIFIDEKAFITNPGLELHKVMTEYSSSGSNKAKVLEKIQGAKFAQRVAFPDHEQSLFVPAFLKEAMLSLPAEEQTALRQKKPAAATEIATPP